MGPTVRDIAKLAGVSPATVSRVMNGHPSVHPSLAHRVQVAARNLGYTRPNNRPLLQSLAVLITWAAERGGSYYTLTLVREITRAARRHDFDVVVHFADSLPKAAEGGVSLPRQAFSGAILIGNVIDLESTYIRTLHETGIPFFLLSRGPTHGEYSYVAVDDYQGAAEATRHLIELGHRRLAHITGPENTRDAADRRRAFIDTCREAGIADADQIIISGDYMEESGLEAARRLISMDPPPTAVFAANDMMAIGAIRGFLEAGARIPEDIAVVGFDDIDLAEYFEPALSTVHVPLAEMARMATDQLISHVKGGEAAFTYSKTLLGGRLVVRRSCGALTKG